MKCTCPHANHIKNGNGCEYQLYRGTLFDATPAYRLVLDFHEGHVQVHESVRAESLQIYWLWVVNSQRSIRFVRLYQLFVYIVVVSCDA